MSPNANFSKKTILVAQAKIRLSIYLHHHLLDFALNLVNREQGFYNEVFGLY
jgi:hypothetical protein